jgi:ketosteroid isomerase-like protein
MANKEKIMQEIKEIVNRETKAWDTQDIELLLSIFHPDFVWVWPKDNKSHNPVDWKINRGKFNYSRYEKAYKELFFNYKLVHNKRSIKKIVVSEYEDGAFAVVDIDTLWIDKYGKKDNWKGRVCKVYAKIGKEWKLTMHTGVLDYSLIK